MKVARFEFMLFGINTYVVYDPDTRDCAVIDPAMMGEEEEKAMDGFIERERLKVTHVINTHLHIDHSIGNRYMTEKYHVPVLAHKADEPLGDNLTSQARMFGLGVEAANVSISQYIEDGDEIRIGDGTLKAMHVPGHSPGSIVLYDPKDGFVIAGDVLFNGSIGRTDLMGGSMPQLLKGIREKLLVLPDDTVVYPGHGEPTTIGAERRSNPFLQ